MKVKLKSLAQILAGCQKWNQNGNYYHIHINDSLKIGFRSFYKSYLNRDVVDLAIKKNRRGETLPHEFWVCGNEGQIVFPIHATWIDHFIVEPAAPDTLQFSERLSVKPDTSQFIKLTGIEIFRLTPKTNCKACGSTCLQFAMNLTTRRSKLDDCPYLSDGDKYRICGSEKINAWNSEKDVWTTEEKHINITELTWDQLFEV